MLQKLTEIGITFVKFVIHKHTGMKIKMTLILAFLISNFSFGQQKDCDCNYITDYYQLVYKGQYNYLKENYDSAYIFLKQAEKNCPLLDLDMIDEPGMLAEISARKRLFEDTANYLEMKLRNGSLIEHFIQDPIYSEFWKSNPGKELKKNSQKIYDEWLSTRQKFQTVNIVVVTS